MPSLRELQAGFGRALRAAGSEPRYAALFEGAGGRDLSRLSVYRANVEGNCAGALASAYPIVRKIVGEGFFAGLARDYARSHPSRNGNLNVYGRQFAAFLGAHAGVGDLPYLADVARMEWHAHLAYYAEDPAPFDTHALAALPPERHRLLCPRLAPPCALMSSPWPLGRIWTIHQDDYEESFDIDLASGPDRVLIHRPRWRAVVTTLGEGEFRFLLAASSGATLVAAIEAAAAADATFDPSTALANWIHAKVIDRLV